MLYTIKKILFKNWKNTIFKTSVNKIERMKETKRNEINRLHCGFRLPKITMRVKTVSTAFNFNYKYEGNHKIPKSSAYPRESEFAFFLFEYKSGIVSKVRLRTLMRVIYKH